MQIHIHNKISPPAPCPGSEILRLVIYFVKALKTSAAKKKKNVCAILEGESFDPFLVVKVVAQKIFSEYPASYSNEAKDK